MYYINYNISMSKTYIKDVTHFKKLGIKKPYKPPYKPFKRIIPETHLKPWEQTHIPHKRADESSVAMLFAKIKAGKYGDITEFFSKTNTTLNITDKGGNNALHILLDGESQMEEPEILDLVKYLVKQGVAPGGYNKKNVTPLHLAAKMQYTSIVKFLCSTGVNANVEDNQGMTPLHYTTLGLITECKKRKKVGALIPEPEKGKNVTKTDLKNTTINIINVITKDKEYAKFMGHIKKTLAKINDIYPDIFKKTDMDIDTQLTNILTDFAITNENRAIKIDALISNILESTKDLVKNKFKTSLKHLLIQPNQIDGWGPKIDITKKDEYKTVIKDETRVLSGNVFEMIDKIQIKHKEKVADTIKTLKDNMNTINSNIIKSITKSIKKIIRDLYYAIQCYEAAGKRKDKGADNKNRYIDYSLKGIEIAKLCLYKNNDQFYYMEIGVFNKLDIKLEKKTFTMKPEDISIPEFSKKYYEKHNIEKKNQLSLNFTNKNKYTDDGTIVKNMGVLPIEFQKTNNIDVGSNEQKFFNEQKYQYISKLKFAINQIEKYFNIIKWSIDTIENHFDKEHYYDIYHRLVTNIIYCVISIYQYIHFANPEKDYIINKTEEIQQKFITVYRNNLDSDFLSPIEAGLEALGNIGKNVMSIYGNLNKLYREIYTIYDGLNSVIDVLNRNSGVTLIQNFFMKDEKTLYEYKNVNFRIEKIYDNMFPTLVPIPDTINGYTTEYIKYDINNETQVNKLKKILYERYIPNINKDNYQTYYSDLAGISEKKISETKTGINNVPQLGDIYKTIDINFVKDPSLKEDLKTPNLENAKNNKFTILPKIGYLTTYDLTKIKPDVPYGTDEIKDIVNKGDDKRQGSVGYIAATTGNTLKHKIDSILFPSIGNLLDDHFSILKFYLVQYIIKHFGEIKVESDPTKFTETDAEKKDAEQFLYNLQTNIKNKELIKGMLYTTVGQIADELIMNHIDHNIQAGIIQYIKDKIKEASPGEAYAEVIKKLGTPGNPQIFAIDTGFKLKLNDLFDEILSSFHTPIDVSEDDIFDRLQYTIKIMKDEDPKKKAALYTHRRL